MLRAHGISVTVGVAADEASRLNRAYLTSMRLHRPWVIAKVAVSADGYVSAAPGVRTDLTSVPARRHAQRVRASVDAVAVGSETVLVDDPELTVRDVYRARPLTRVIFDRRLRTPATAAVLRSRAAGPVLILTSPEALSEQADHARTLESRGATVIPVATGRVLDGLRAISAYDVQSVVVEGGPTLHAACWDEGVVDQVHVYVAPTVIGPRGVCWGSDIMLTLSANTRLRAQAIGRDVFMDGYVHRAD
jgi:diaminohydroxyphosphoribosylaminopyrimidine deaminase/5-amino-6-(5-phosphoribosylamino)uracil reductase